MVLQQHPVPPRVRGTTPPPPVVVTHPLLPTPANDPNSIHIITDTSVVSLTLDGFTNVTNPPWFYGQFPGLRRVLGDISTANVMAIPKSDNLCSLTVGLKPEAAEVQ